MFEDGLLPWKSPVVIHAVGGSIVFFSDLWSQECKMTTEYNYIYIYVLSFSFGGNKFAKVPSEGSCPTLELM